MLATDAITARHSSQHARILTLGKQTDITTALLVAKSYQQPVRYVIHPPSGPREQGFQVILDPRDTLPHGCHGITTSQTDGVVVPNTGAAVIFARDCPIVTLYSPITDRLVTVHAGRPALSSHTGNDCCPYTIMTAAVRNVIGTNLDRTDTISAYITAGISQRHFAHVGDDAELHLAHFRRWHPDRISGPDNRLDLVGVITDELVRRGVTPEQITHDGLCTYDHPALASYRAGDTSRNLVLVMRAS